MVVVLYSVQFLGGGWSLIGGDIFDHGVCLGLVYAGVVFSNPNFVTFKLRFV